MAKPTKSRRRTSKTPALAPPAAPATPILIPAQVLGQLPGLRGELVNALNDILANYRQGRWGPSELDGGKLCEIVYTILRGHVDGSYPQRASKSRDMVAACRDLEQADGSIFPRSVRIQIPRVLIALYEIRNNSGVGHVGGDVDPNHMDASVVVGMAKWLVAELVVCSTTWTRRQPVPWSSPCSTGSSR